MVVVKSRGIVVLPSCCIIYIHIITISIIILTVCGVKVRKREGAV